MAATHQCIHSEAVIDQLPCHVSSGLYVAWVHEELTV